MAQLIRVAIPGDEGPIVRFNQALALESEGKTLDPAVVARGVAAVLADPGKGLYYLALQKGEIVGQTLTTYEWSDWRCGWVWWIQSVYVAPEARGTGVFRQIFDEIRRRAISANAVGLRLYMEEHNPARAVYESLGMREAGFTLFEMMW